MTPIRAIIAVAAALFLTACEDKAMDAMAHGDTMDDAAMMSGDAGAMADDTMAGDAMMSN